MIKTNCIFAGLELTSPLIAGSSGLTNSVEKIKKLEKAGAGAVILKSLFEEQIELEASTLIHSSDFPGASDYVKAYTKENSLNKYVDLIKESKRQTTIPIIASINCSKSTDWVSYSKTIEAAGANAIELNIYIIPSDEHQDKNDIENRYTSIVKKIKSEIKIPVIVKLGQHFTNLFQTIEQLKASGASAFTLFNKFYQPDIDLDTFEITSADILSLPSDYKYPLRWIALVAGEIDKIELSASTGIHDASSAIKMILAGATTVQLCSVLYRHGIDKLTDINEELKNWMRAKGFKTIQDFKGKLRASKIKEPEMYERTQFMKYFSNYQK